MRQGEVKIKLSAYRKYDFILTEPRVSVKDAAKNRGTHIGQIKLRRSCAFETVGRQVPFSDRLCKSAPGDFVNLKAGKGMVLAVALDFSIVHIVVFKAAKIVAGERVRAVALCYAAGIVKPN